MPLIKRKPKYEKVESDVIDASDVPQPGKVQQEQTIADYYMEEYGDTFRAQDFGQFHGTFESEVCKLLFAIFSELKKQNDKK